MGEIIFLGGNDKEKEPAAEEDEEANESEDEAEFIDLVDSDQDSSEELSTDDEAWVHQRGKL